MIWVADLEILAIFYAPFGAAIGKSLCAILYLIWTLNNWFVGSKLKKSSTPQIRQARELVLGTKSIIFTIFSTNRHYIPCQVTPKTSYSCLFMKPLYWYVLHDNIALMNKYSSNLLGRLILALITCPSEQGLHNWFLIIGSRLTKLPRSFSNILFFLFFSPTGTSDRK